MTAQPGIIVLSREDIAGLMSLDDHLTAVETAFRLLGEGKAALPPPLHIAGDGGEFHVKAGSLPLSRSYVAVKLNGNFPSNPVRHGLPTVQGAILLCDGRMGYPLALLDSIEITIARTGAASALAARHLALPDARVATVCGCGEQGRIQLASIANVRPIEKAYAWDLDGGRSEAFAHRMSAELGIEVVAVDHFSHFSRTSEIIVTCTPAREPFLGPEHVSPGTFIAAVGADNPHKQELRNELLAASTVFADVVEQALTMGDLHHAVAAAAMTRDDIAGELGDLVTGRASARRDGDAIIVFDSTGTAVQDVAAAALCYERAVEQGVGMSVQLA